ncbi:hypothetical protein [Pseudomonas sp. P108]|uniref:hypothetical protein n=1 Tax=Pseudomonas sp. P108 TaxID=1837993 RepID=UPI0029346D3C|nr:hypothetical protein [Pseudomonas sp. P108]WNZ86745.1 hypothetical protein QOM10_12545 [Pseudomonas sp. P108]
MISVFSILSGIAFSFTLQRAGKVWDFWLGEKNITEEKKKYKLEKYWLAFARQSWSRLYQRAALLADKMLSNIFGKQPLSAESILKFSFFSIALNCLLAMLPTIFSGAPVTSNAHNLTLWIKITAAFIFINTALDCLAYLLTRYLLRRPPHSTVGIIISFSLVTSIGWLATTISLVVGGAMTAIPLLNNPFSKETFTNILLPIIQSWFFHQLLHPFDSNVAIQGINMGYIALGAIPSLIILLSTLSLMLVLKITADRLHFITSKYFGRILDDKKSFYEHLGFIASLALILLYWIFFGFFSLSSL